MNGKAAKRLRAAFGAKTAEYRKAKQATDTMPTAFAQRPKLVAQRAPKNRDPKPATWPASDDQRAQSRPVIVESPYRRTSPITRWQMQGKASRTEARQSYGLMPKHRLDGIALLHPVGVAL